MFSWTFSARLHHDPFHHHQQQEHEAKRQDDHHQVICQYLVCHKAWLLHSLQAGFNIPHRNFLLLVCKIWLDFLCSLATHNVTILVRTAAFRIFKIPEIAAFVKFVVALNNTRFHEKAHKANLPAITVFKII